MTYINTIYSYGDDDIDSVINNYCVINNVEIVQVISLNEHVAITTAKVVFRKL